MKTPQILITTSTKDCRLQQGYHFCCYSTTLALSGRVVSDVTKKLPQQRGPLRRVISSVMVLYGLWWYLLAVSIVVILLRKFHVLWSRCKSTWIRQQVNDCQEMDVITNAIIYRNLRSPGEIFGNVWVCGTGKVTRSRQLSKMQTVYILHEE